MRRVWRRGAARPLSREVVGVALVGAILCSACLPEPSPHTHRLEESRARVDDAASPSANVVPTLGLPAPPRLTTPTLGWAGVVLDASLPPTRALPSLATPPAPLARGIHRPDAAERRKKPPRREQKETIVKIPQRTLPAGTRASVAILGALSPLARKLWAPAVALPEEKAPELVALFVVLGNEQGRIRADRGQAQGGLDRIAAQLQTLEARFKRAKLPPPIILNAGATLTPAEGSRLEETGRRPEIARLFIEVYGERGVDALLVTTRELRLGDLVAQARASNLPLLSSNLSSDDEARSTPFEDHLILEWGETKIGVIGASPRGTHRSKTLLDSAGLVFQEPRAATQRAAQAARDAGAQRLVLLSGLGSAGTSNLLRAWDAAVTPQPDLVISSGSGSSAPRTRRVEDTATIIEPGRHGERMLVVAMRVDEKGQLDVALDPLMEEGVTLVATLEDITGVDVQLNKGRPHGAEQAKLSRLMKGLAKRIEKLSEGPLTPQASGILVTVIDVDEDAGMDKDVTQRIEALPSEASRGAAPKRPPEPIRPSRSGEEETKPPKKPKREPQKSGVTPQRPPTLKRRPSPDKGSRRSPRPSPKPPVR